MKIGIDATCWGNKRGFGRFTRELLEALLEIDETNEYLFFVDGDTNESETIPSRVTKIIVNTDVSPIQAASAQSRRSIKDLLAMSREVFRHKVDVFFFPAVYSYFPVFNRTKIIVTIHDVIADHNPELIFPNAKSKFFWKLKQNAAIRQADLITTVSEYSKRQIIEYFNLPKSRMRVISEGVRPIFRVAAADKERIETLNKYQLNANENFLLSVGGISPHKNLGTLVTAFKKICETRTDVKLVLVGDYKDDPFFSAYPSLKKQIAELNLENKVIFTGYISDEELVDLYNEAALLVFPSFEEGFGLPAIEAMSCGTPVAASNCSSLPEVLGDVGRFFDPRNAENMADVIGQVLGNAEMRNTMKKSGLARAEQFKWKKAAQDTLAIFNELVASKPAVKTQTQEVLVNSRNH
jgi:glycosyltransferase involved in cell wall biosynthesis